MSTMLTDNFCFVTVSNLNFFTWHTNAWDFVNASEMSQRANLIVEKQSQSSQIWVTLKPHLPLLFSCSIFPLSRIKFKKRSNMYLILKDYRIKVFKRLVTLPSVWWALTSSLKSIRWFGSQPIWPCEPLKLSNLNLWPLIITCGL